MEGNILVDIDKQAREERRRIQAEGARRVIDSGVMDDLFAKIDFERVQGHLRSSRHNYSHQGEVILGILLIPCEAKWSGPKQSDIRAESY
jgi:hypothetical protein